MNATEHFICSSSLWRYFTQRQILPWVLSGAPLGDHLLEIGAGYGVAVSALKSRVARVTALEYDHKSILKGEYRHNGVAPGAVCGDAAQQPFAGQTFSSALAILVLHHLKSAGLQDQMFGEVFRVLRPGGVFIAFDIRDSWFYRAGHIRSTFTPVDPDKVSFRIIAAGFSSVAIDSRKGGFRLVAARP
jgi:ubiquinone/menaquinone biosynthesis C-methylase UbiE